MIAVWDNGDDRMMQVYDNLARDTNNIEYLSTEELRKKRKEIEILILPVKGMDVQDSFWLDWNPQLKIFCGLPNTAFHQLPYEIEYYMKDKAVLHNNAILTAEGVLNELIGCCCRSIYELSIDIIGYGNCGSVIYEMLSNLQLNVRVIRRQCATSEHFLSIEEWKDCGDVIINTSIQCVLDRNRMMSWQQKPIIIDIATPDVIDRKCAKELGIKIIRAGNLPGRFASCSAGNIIAEYIRGKLKS